MDSKYFLREVIQMLHERGWWVGNADCTICLERPKVNPHVPEIKQVLASLMKVETSDVSIKATTNETLGYVGRDEGVCAYAVVLIQHA
jgi:2-C-methyl-D-erythritol 2,4-cyclodiphosphate synthase